MPRPIEPAGPIQQSGGSGSASTQAYVVGDGLPTPPALLPRAAFELSRSMAANADILGRLDRANYGVRLAQPARIADRR
jgi:hypothetical protein